MIDFLFSITTILIMISGCFLFILFLFLAIIDRITISRRRKYWDQVLSEIEREIDERSKQ